MFDDARISTRTESGDATQPDVHAIRKAIIKATGGKGPLWASVSKDQFVQAFQSWKSGPLPDCDWAGFARAVSAPARKGQIGPVLTTDESGSYTRVSRPFFIDRDTAIVLIREVADKRHRVTRRLVFTYRDGDRWLMLPHTFEEQATAPQ